ncbi:uncharacterized protein LOC144169356 [Haemaphysalis longicornis]
MKSSAASGFSAQAAFERDVKATVLQLVKSLECPICLELLNDPLSTSCHHRFCRLCLEKALQDNYKIPCPLCKAVVTKRSLSQSDLICKLVEKAEKLALAVKGDLGMEVLSQQRIHRVSTASLRDKEPFFLELCSVVPPMAKSSHTTTSSQGNKRAGSACADADAIAAPANKRSKVTPATLPDQQTAAGDIRCVGGDSRTGPKKQAQDTGGKKEPPKREISARKKQAISYAESSSAASVAAADDDNASVATSRSDRGTHRSRLANAPAGVQGPACDSDSVKLPETSSTLEASKVQNWLTRCDDSAQASSVSEERCLTAGTNRSSNSESDSARERPRSNRFFAAANPTSVSAKGHVDAADSDPYKFIPSQKSPHAKPRGKQKRIRGKGRVANGTKRLSRRKSFEPSPTGEFESLRDFYAEEEARKKDDDKELEIELFVTPAGMPEVPKPVKTQKRPSRGGTARRARKIKSNLRLKPLEEQVAELRKLVEEGESHELTVVKTLPGNVECRRVELAGSTSALKDVSNLKSLVEKSKVTDIIASPMRKAPQQGENSQGQPPVQGKPQPLPDRLGESNTKLQLKSHTELPKETEVVDLCTPVQKDRAESVEDCHDSVPKSVPAPTGNSSHTDLRKDESVTPNDSVGHSREKSHPEQQEDLSEEPNNGEVLSLKDFEGMFKKSNRKTFDLGASTQDLESLGSVAVDTLDLMTDMCNSFKGVAVSEPAMDLPEEENAAERDEQQLASTPPSSNLASVDQGSSVERRNPFASPPNKTRKMQNSSYSTCSLRNRTALEPSAALERCVVDQLEPSGSPPSRRRKAKDSPRASPTSDGCPVPKTTGTLGCCSNDEGTPNSSAAAKVKASNSPTSCDRLSAATCSEEALRGLEHSASADVSCPGCTAYLSVSCVNGVVKVILKEPARRPVLVDVGMCTERPCTKVIICREAVTQTESFEAQEPDTEAGFPSNQPPLVHEPLSHRTIESDLLDTAGTDCVGTDPYPDRYFAGCTTGARTHNKMDAAKVDPAPVSATVEMEDQGTEGAVAFCRNNEQNQEGTEILCENTEDQAVSVNKKAHLTSSQFGLKTIVEDTEQMDTESSVKPEEEIEQPRCSSICSPSQGACEFQDKEAFSDLQCSAETSLLRSQNEAFLRLEGSRQLPELGSKSLEASSRSAVRGLVQHKQSSAQSKIHKEMPETARSEIDSCSQEVASLAAKDKKHASQGKRRKAKGQSRKGSNHEFVESHAAPTSQPAIELEQASTQNFDSSATPSLATAPQVQESEAQEPASIASCSPKEAAKDDRRAEGPDEAEGPSSDDLSHWCSPVKGKKAALRGKNEARRILSSSDSASQEDNSACKVVETPSRNNSKCRVSRPLHNVGEESDSDDLMTESEADELLRRAARVEGHDEAAAIFARRAVAPLLSNKRPHMSEVLAPKSNGRSQEALPGTRLHNQTPAVASTGKYSSLWKKNDVSISDGDNTENTDGRCTTATLSSTLSGGLDRTLKEQMLEQDIQEMKKQMLMLENELQRTTGGGSKSDSIGGGAAQVGNAKDDDWDWDDSDGADEMAEVVPPTPPRKPLRSTSEQPFGSTK